MGGDAHPPPSPSFSLHLLSPWREEEGMLVLPWRQQELLLATMPLLRQRPWWPIPARGAGPSGEVIVIMAVVVEVDGPRGGGSTSCGPAPY